MPNCKIFHSQGVVLLVKKGKVTEKMHFRLLSMLHVYKSSQDLGEN